jgi:hypothetical protein
MTTSGVTTYSLGTNEIVNAALRKLSVLGDGTSATATQLTNGIQALNLMLKTFTTKGMPLWVITEYSITPTATRTYTIGVGQTTNTPAPLKVLQVLRDNSTDGTSIPLNIRTHYDYNLLNNSTNTGVPTEFWYEPLNQVGKLHIWPTPDANTIAYVTLRMVYQKPFEDMVGSTDTLDFPQWWQEAVVYGLASRLAPEYGTPLADRNVIRAEAQEFLNAALEFGTEEGSFFIQPDRTR